jgi:hypothetical protein
MTAEEIEKLHSGDEITWNDPDNGICSKTGIILDIEFLPDDQIATITFQDGSYIQCFYNELS